MAKRAKPQRPRPLALVTGAGVRLGKALAMAFADADCDVLLHANRSYRDAERTAAKIRKQGVNAWTIAADLGNAKQLSQFSSKVVELHGAPDFLILNAANFVKGSLTQADAATWDRSHHVNLRAQAILAGNLGAAMKQRGAGAIVFISDAAGLALWRGYGAHSIAKAALIPTARLLARELAPNVRVNVVAPGPVLFPPEYSAAQKKAAVASTALKRPGCPEDVIKAVMFMCIDAPYVTGAVLPVDGGRHLLGVG